MTGPVLEAGGGILAGPALAARPRPGGLGTALPGPLLFARFAFPPNRLGLCGPETGGTLPERVRAGSPRPGAATDRRRSSRARGRTSS